MSKDTIGIIDYGMGNLRSVGKALEFLGFDARIIKTRTEIKTCKKIILPGVGAFDQAISTIKKSELDRAIDEAVAQGKHFLGICLGMQLLFDISYENGSFKGLGILPGDIVRLTGVDKIPHMGWNSLCVKKRSPLFDGLDEENFVYFVHSYYVRTSDEIISATCSYGNEITTAVQRDNVFALQFHPEKSGWIGLQILKNFGGLTNDYLSGH